MIFAEQYNLPILLDVEMLNGGKFILEADPALTAGEAVKAVAKTLKLSSWVGYALVASSGNLSVTLDRSDHLFDTLAHFEKLRNTTGGALPPLAEVKDQKIAASASEYLRYGFLPGSLLTFCFSRYAPQNLPCRFRR
jgi:hypothetical protein